MKIYNSLTKKKEEFTPINPGVINIYTCGVTVYDDCHIGHARSLYIFDVMRRYLEYRGYKVNFVRNITDIDDKIINRANELNIEWRELVDKYIASYKEDLESLGVREGLLDKDGEEPRATKNIPEMISYITELIDKGYAYESDGDVYFDVRKFKEYGKLSGQDIDKVREGARISPCERKKDALDFALWKRSKENEPWWESPWSKGRPGWHIECSVMSQRFLNSDTLDIHAGGRDLIFPHHENEVAQAQAKTGKTFANYWIHHGLLTIDAQKMSKSLGNFITIKDALKKYSPDSIKLLMLGTHYSHQLNFSDKSMQQAVTGLQRFISLFGKIKSLGALKNVQEQDVAKNFKESIDELKEEFIKVMDDDFNTPQALSKLFEMINRANVESENKRESLIYVKKVITELGDIFGLFSKQKKLDLEFLDDELVKYVQGKIDEREEARKEKDFKKADSIRDQLQKESILIEDTSEGTTWRQV